MKVLILAAKGQIAELLIQKLIKKDNVELTLFARNAEVRLSQYRKQAKLITGDLANEKDVEKAVTGQKMVILAMMPGEKIAKNVIQAMKKAKVQRLVVTGGYCGLDFQKGEQAIDNSSLVTTYLHMPWLRDHLAEKNYRIIPDGSGDEVTRNGVAQFLVDLIADPKQYENQDIGIQAAE